jgi:predicted DsbA family dithiol-disulfide isomerase
MSPVFETYPDRVVVDVWSDVMCPYCYLGTTYLSLAAEHSHVPVDIRYHSFQLMPELPHDAAIGLIELLEKERGVPRDQAEAMNARVETQGNEVGLSFDIGAVLATNTRAAHRLIHLADRHGKQRDMVRRLFQAYFTDGLNIGDIDVLTDLAAEVGIDGPGARAALVSGNHDIDVDNDIELVQRLGIRGVPFFVIDGTYTVSGAQPVDVFTRVLDTAWAAHDQPPSTRTG